jgi:L-threonylcarbamoyladenylate synthase
MEIIKISIASPDKTTVSKACKILSAGGIAVYPTDTAYGIGVNAYDEKAIRKLYELKGRGFNKPTHVIVRDWKMIEEVAIPSASAKKLYDKFLPGPITLILKKKGVISDTLTANLPTLGVRIPDNKVTKLISKHVPFPYTTPSANRAGGKTPYSLKEIRKELDIKSVDLILDAGSLTKTLPSTLVDVSANTPKVLREGPVSEELILNLLKS